MSIAFLTRDYNGRFPDITPGGCSYYRCLLPMSVSGHKARMGMPAWDAKQGYGVRETETTGVFGFSTVVLKLIMDRWAPKQVELAKALGQRIIVDVDDYHDALTPDNIAYHKTHPDNNKIVNRDNYRQVIAAADTIVVSTPCLYELYKTQHPDVRMVRNGVNMLQFEKKKHTTAKPVIGWTGGTNYRNGDLEQLTAWLPEFLEEHDLIFHHAGHDPHAPSFADVVGLPTHRVTTSPITPIEYYALGLERFDIGIVPLSDIPFNHAKSNIKGLEYAAANIPFVASPLPEYALLNTYGVGALADTPDVWRSHMTALLDYTYRKKAAARARTVVAKEWSIEARAAEWKEVFA